MCTLTWRTEDGLEVFFNRDELKTRSRAEPPREFMTPSGSRYLSPIDPDAGGTWMLANEHGIVLCLLNRWHEQTSQPFPKSRGRIVTELADSKGLLQVKETLSSLCPGARPFDLVAFEGIEALGFSWDGNQLTPFQPQMPLTSSSYKFEEVRQSRQEAFRPSVTLEQYQSSQGQDCTAHTVRMNRPDAQTWSRTVLKVLPNEIRWDYWEEFPDLAKEPALHQTKLGSS